MIKVINADALREERVKQNRADKVIIFKGSADMNKSASEVQSFGSEMIVPMRNAKWEGSEGYHKLWNEINYLKKKNAAQTPSASELEALLGKVFIDMTRRTQEAGDLTGLFANEIVDLEAPETVNGRYLYPFVGKMGEVTGSNDSVNLIEQKTGDTVSFDLKIYAVGWKSSLANLLYNKLFDMQKANQAAVDADTDRRNAAIIGTIVGTTFDASQQQAADTTTGASYDVLMYNTIRKAIKTLRALKDPQTGKKIAVPRMSLLVNSADSWDIARVIGGQLQTAGTKGSLTSVNTAALPIQNIIEYDGGITDGKTYGKETLSFPGVTQGKAYLFVPGEYLYSVSKRPLTMETGTGSVLQLSTEERAWYRVFGNFMDDFLGSSAPGTSLGSGYGAIVEITLPS